MRTDTSKQFVTSETVKFLFGKFYARYGAKWSSQYPADMMRVVHEEWLLSLNSLNLDDIKRGLNSWHEDWPPNIEEFKKACMPAPCYRSWNGRNLPPPRNKELGRQAMQKIKDLLR